MIRPLPPSLNKLPLGYEEDQMLAHQRDAFMVLPMEMIEQFYWERGYRVRLRRKPVIHHEDCFLLCRSDGELEPHVKVLRKMKWKISEHIGTELAAFYNFIPQHYDSEFHETYKLSITVCCKFGQKHCVRPSHLIPCTYLGRPLRP